MQDSKKMGKWGNGKTWKWGNGKMGKRENGEQKGSVP